MTRAAALLAAVLLAAGCSLLDGDDEADGTGRRNVTTGGRSSDPVWIGDRFAYARHPDRRNCLAPSSGISTMRPDGSGRQDVVFPAPRRFAWNGYYGLRPFGRVEGRPLVVVGVRTEWGNELAMVDRRTGRVWRPDSDPRPRTRDAMYVQYLSRDGRHALGTACGAEFPCSIEVYSVLERRGRVLASGRVAGAHWNR